MRGGFFLKKKPLKGCGFPLYQFEKCYSSVVDVDKPNKQASERTKVTFTGVLEAIGKGFEKGLQWAVTYAVPVEKLVGLLFPAAAPELTVLADATGLIQNAVIEVEQKYAAAGVQSGTGTQKLATVMTLVGPVVTSLLAKAGIAGTSTSYVQSLVSAVVAILNVQAMPVTAATSGATA